MELKTLEYIISIAEQGSLSKAAQQFYISQSALSQQLQKTERLLGAPLFIRGNHGLTLTLSGELYVDAAKRILAIRDELYQTIRSTVSEQKHSLRIATAPGRSTAMLSEIYPRFLELFPDYEITLTECPTAEAERLLIQEKVDYALTMIPSARLNDPHPFQVRSLHHEPLLLVVGSESSFRPADYSFDDVFHCTRADLSAFREASFVLPAKATRLRSYVDEFMIRNSFAPHTSFDTINTLNIFRSMSKSNICTIVTSGFVPNTTDYLCFSLGEENEYAMDYCICWSPSRTMNEVDKKLIDLCGQYVSANWL